MHAAGPMRLAAKIFLATSLVLLALVVVAGWSLLAVQRVVEVNRAIITRSIPALQLESALTESMAALVRLESRYEVLEDRRYQDLWNARADQTAEGLARLDELVGPSERKRLAKVMAAFTRYRATANDQAGASAAASRTQRSLAQLKQATGQALKHAQLAARRLERRTWRAVMLVLPFSLLALVAGTVALSLRMTRALARLSAATREVADGSFREPLVVRRNDEIGDLARAFNRMAERLQELDRLKEEFFSNVSHELRTPLTAIREATLLLRDRVPGPLAARQARLVDLISLSTERLLGLVNQILELARLRAGLIAIDRGWLDLDQLVDRALEELRPQAEARGVTLGRRGGPVGRMRGDAERLLQVLVNLLGNAIKYTPNGGSVVVVVGEQRDRVEIAVEDTGVGIPADLLPRIFDRFWQADPARGGSGLGLTIVKGVVEAHGGQVQVESAEGRGTRFTVHLPREAAAA